LRTPQSRRNHAGLRRAGLHRGHTVGRAADHAQVVVAVAQPVGGEHPPQQERRAVVRANYGQRLAAQIGEAGDVRRGDEREHRTPVLPGDHGDVVARLLGHADRVVQADGHQVDAAGHEPAPGGTRIGKRGCLHVETLLGEQPARGRHVQVDVGDRGDHDPDLDSRGRLRKGRGSRLRLRQSWGGSAERCRCTGGRHRNGERHCC
jgi:hypothetical protein